MRYTAFPYSYTTDYTMLSLRQYRRMVVRQQMVVLRGKYGRAWHKASQPGFLGRLKAKWYRAKCHKYLEEMWKLHLQDRQDLFLFDVLDEAITANMAL